MPTPRGLGPKSYITKGETGPETGNQMKAGPNLCCAVHRQLFRLYGGKHRLLQEVLERP